MNKTLKYRLYPTRRQRQLLQKTLNECRWLYNHFLEKRRTLWQNQKKSLNYYSQAKSIPELKKSRPSLTNVYSQVLQNVAMRVDLAFQAFFRRVKAKNGKAGYPRFKGANRYDSFTYPQTGFEIKENVLALSKIGHIKVKLHRPIIGTIKTCTIRKRNDKWYVCFAVECEPNPLPQSNKAVGVDVGLETFATLSNGEKIENPRFFKTDKKALAKAQRKLSRQKKNSLEWQKAKKVVARIHERIANRRHNFIHQVARRLVNKFGIICIEKLDVKNIMRNNFRSINRGIADVAWSQFATVLMHKAEEAGHQFVAIDPRGTSQICSQCGAIVKKTLSERWHDCPICNAHLPRDLNASLNILRVGLHSLGIRAIEAPTGGIATMCQCETNTIRGY